MAAEESTEQTPEERRALFRVVRGTPDDRGGERRWATRPAADAGPVVAPRGPAARTAARGPGRLARLRPPPLTS
jgi:hypothetical protein